MYTKTQQVQWLMKMRKVHPDQDTRTKADKYIETIIIEDAKKPSERKLNKTEVVSFIDTNKLATIKKM